ncbi:MAG: VWA domain-containing protein [Alphaproteobacteria bacterium]|nr:VWA domain-containing protein [Alphaproteobacteria bacterium]
MVPRLHRREERRGNYSILFALTLIGLVGFGALAVDTAYMRLAHAEAQDVADAASQAALVVLRASGDVEQAEAAARAVVAANKVVGQPAVVTEIDFGNFNERDDDPTFRPSGVFPNAVHVEVARSDDAGNPVPHLLARTLGHQQFDVSASSTSATRSVELTLVMDITLSWGEADFADAREASLLALEMLEETASTSDTIAMSVFNGNRANAFTPAVNLTNSTAIDGVFDDWSQLQMASVAGYDRDHFDNRDCEYNYNNSGHYEYEYYYDRRGRLKKRQVWVDGYDKNDFAQPTEGGCYPNMPRAYYDELTTDQSSGLTMARQMIASSGSNASYRAVVLLTDGRPNQVYCDQGDDRNSDGYTEDRWDEYVGPKCRNTNDIRNAAIEEAQRLWEEQGVHVWVVSFIADDWMMYQMPQGDGYYVRTNDPDELAELFAQIVSELPMAIVE